MHRAIFLIFLFMIALLQSMAPFLHTHTGIAHLSGFHIHVPTMTVGDTSEHPLLAAPTSLRDEDDSPEISMPSQMYKDEQLIQIDLSELWLPVLIYLSILLAFQAASCLLPTRPANPPLFKQPVYLIPLPAAPPLTH